MAEFVVPVAGGGTVAVSECSPWHSCRRPTCEEHATPFETAVRVVILARVDGPPRFGAPLTILWDTTATVQTGTWKSHLRKLLLTGNGTGMLRYVPGMKPRIPSLLLWECSGTAPLYIEASATDVPLVVECVRDEWQPSQPVPLTSLMAPVSELVLKFIGSASFTPFSPETFIRFVFLYHRIGAPYKLVDPVFASALDLAVPVGDLLNHWNPSIERVHVHVYEPGRTVPQISGKTVFVRVVDGKLLLAEPTPRAALQTVMEAMQAEDLASQARREIDEVGHVILRPISRQTAVLRACADNLAKVLDIETEAQLVAADQLLTLAGILCDTGVNQFSGETIGVAQRLLRFEETSLHGPCTLVGIHPGGPVPLPSLVPEIMPWHGRV